MTQEAFAEAPAAASANSAPMVRDAARARAIPWLFSAPLDLAMLAVPALTTAVAAGLSAMNGNAADVSTRANTHWIAQFVLGNTTHVILTFLLLGARPDVLRATPGQARLVVLGSLAAFAVSFGLFALTGARYHDFVDFGLAIALVLSFHHTLSQARGIWSLYNLRARGLGLPAPTPRERSLMGLFAPIGLLLVAVRFLFVEKAPGLEIPFFSAFPSIPAVLPHAAVYPMALAWVAFACAVVREFTRGERPNTAKLVYVSGHLAGVALAITAPAWGAIFWAGVHGLEYFALSRQMLAPRDDAERGRLAHVGLAMALAALPLLLVGVVNAPFAKALGVGSHAAYAWARYALNGVVIAHYFADAFIYRFRIPEVRAVALRRLGFPA